MTKAIRGVDIYAVIYYNPHLKFERIKREKNDP